MSASTASYASMLGGMWAPEGSEINERLKRLQELEQMRKDREAKRQELLKKKEQSSVSGIPIVRSTRLKSSNADEGASTGIALRRAISMREDSENYGGARPKLGGVSATGSDDTGFSGGTLFSEIKASLLGPRKPLRRDNESESRGRLGSSDSDSSSTTSSYKTYKYESSRPVNGDKTYAKSFTTSEDSGTGGSLFSGITSTVLGGKQQYERQPYTSRIGDKKFQTKSGQDEYEYDEYGNSYSTYQGNDNLSEINEDDHGEEPKHFIERLKYGKTNGYGYNGNIGTQYSLQSVPTVPPFKYQQYEANNDTNNISEPTEDIISVAHEISTAFGNHSPLQSPEKTTFDTNEAINPNESVIYEIHEVNYDSSGDEEGKILPVRESFYNARPSEWGIVGKTPGKLDQMHEYFTGEKVGEDPNISRELDGAKVKEELEKSFSDVKNEKKRVSDRSSGRKTPTKLKKTPKKEVSPGTRSKSPCDKLKKAESENESVHTSESEFESSGLKKPTPRQKIGQTSSTPKSNEKNGMSLSLSDKLAKLESLTQEKQRKQSVDENDIKKAVPSYMSGTTASARKRARTNDQSPTPSRDLKRDVRELKQFVRENSVPSTPVSSPVKLFSEIETSKTVVKSTKEVSVQTEYIIDFPDINYICKHCGKASSEEVKTTPLTEENVTNKFEKYTEKQSSPRDDASKQSGTKFSSKDSVKSFGETSTKSEKTFRYKPKSATGNQSYMKGTTSSRLKTSAQTSDAKGRKGSVPDIIHKAEQESAKASTSLRGNVSDKLKAIEKVNRAEKSKPTLSLFRGKSVERERPEVAAKPKLTKSKSVDQVSVLNTETSVQDTEMNEETHQSDKSKDNETVPVHLSNTPASPGEKRTRAQMLQKTPQSPQLSKPPVEKLDLSSIVSPISPRSPRSPIRKPALASPRVKDSEVSPRSETSDLNDDNRSVELKGQFTKLEDNPFIRNDAGRRNSLKGNEKGESVWEKAEIRSRDSSLKRSNSTSQVDQERPSSRSSLKRHNTSAGEKSSVSELTWSDSGSAAGSLRGSRSSLYGSNSSLNRDGISAFHRPTPVSSSSSASVMNQNTKLNSVVSPGSTRHPVSGAIETDIDAVFDEQVKEPKPVIKNEEFNEETVNQAHLEFAKKACDKLDFELLKTDSQHINGLDKNQNEEKSENTNGFQNMNGESNDVKVNGVGNNKKDKGKKKYLKGKLFKK